MLQLNERGARPRFLRLYVALLILLVLLTAPGCDAQTDPDTADGPPPPASLARAHRGRGAPPENDRVTELRKRCEARCRNGGLSMCWDGSCAFEERYECECQWPTDAQTGAVVRLNGGSLPLVRARLVSMERMRCRGDCVRAAEARDAVCAADFTRARCAAASGEAIARCNAEVRATRDTCLGATTTWRSHCEADCDAWDPKYELEWPAPQAPTEERP